MLDVVLAAPAADGPSLADWLQGWGSVAAVVATLVLLWHEMREARRGRKAAADERREAAADRELARQDRELAAAERRDAEMMQARTIAIEDIELYEERPAKYGYAPPGVRARVVNYSQGPVHDVWVEFVGEEEPPQRFALQVRRMLGPGTVLPFEQSLDNDRIQVRETGVMTPRAKLVVFFVDMYGRRWRIEEATQPVRVTEWRPLGY